jgi:hypothetical protein
MEGAQMSLPVQVSDAGHDETLHALMRPASEKRQGTKSREWGTRRRCGRYGDLTSARGAGRADCGGRDGCLASAQRCGRRGKWGDRRSDSLREGIGVATTDESDGPAQAGVLPGESRP